MADTLISVETVSKKFCKSLKRSLWYGVKDLASEISGLRKERHTLRKQEFWAIKDLSFELKRGEILGLIGPNGAGKTTTLRLLNGLVKPDEGRITVRGRIGALIELGAGFNPVLTGRENIYVSAAVLGIPKKDIDKKLNDIIEFADIGDFIGAPVQSYSSGMKVRLGFAVAINLRPDIMLIDEVLAVGDLAFKNKCHDAIREIRESGTAFVFVSHNLSQVQALCDKAIYLKGGQAVMEGSTETVLSAYVTDSSDQGVAVEYEPGTEDYLLMHDVQLLDGKGEPINQIVSGDAITVRVTFEARRGLDSPLFHFRIHEYGEERSAVNFLQQMNEHRPSFSPGLHTIDISVKSFPLLAGQYRLGLVVHSHNGLGKYARYPVLRSINVATREAQLLESSGKNGLIELESSWRVLSEAETVGINRHTQPRSE